MQHHGAFYLGFNYSFKEPFWGFLVYKGFSNLSETEEQPHEDRKKTYNVHIYSCPMKTHHSLVCIAVAYQMLRNSVLFIFII